MNLKIEFGSFQEFATQLWPCLSEEAMWIASEDPAGVGEVVEFDVTLADGFRLFHGSGRVVSVGPGPDGGPDGIGMLISFDDLDKPSRNLIQKVVSKHLSEGGTRFVPDLHQTRTKVEVVEDDDSDWSRAQLVPEEDPAAAQTVLGLDHEVSGIPEPEVTAEINERVDELVEHAELDIEPTSIGAEIPGAIEEEAWGDTAAADLTSFLKPGDESDETVIAPPPEELETVDLEAAMSAAADAEAPTDPGIDPLDFDAPTVATESPTDPFVDVDPSAAVDPTDFSTATREIEPLPSTYIPPESSLGDDAPVDLDSPVELTDDDWAPPEAPRTNWLLWAVVAIGGVAVGLFFATKLGFDGWGPAAESTGAGSAAGQRPPVVAQRPSGDGVDAAIDATAAAPIADDAAETTADSGAGEAAGEGSSAAEPADAATVDESLPGDDGIPPPPGTETAPAAGSPTPPATAPPPGERASEGAAAGQGTAVVDAATAEAVRLQRITWRLEGEVTVITLELDRRLAADRIETLDVATGAPRHVVKISGLTGGVPDSTAIGSDHVRQLRFGKHRMDGGGMELHVVADLVDGAVEMVAPVAVDGRSLRLSYARP